MRSQRANRPWAVERAGSDDCIRSGGSWRLTEFGIDYRAFSRVSNYTLFFIYRFFLEYSVKFTKKYLLEFSTG